MTSAIHPWRLLRALPHIELQWHDDGPEGMTDFATYVSLRRGLDQEQRRSTLLHELTHLNRGRPAPLAASKEETTVRRLTARLLLPDVKVMGEAMAWAQTPQEAASDLWVDYDVFRDRLRWLHPAELHYLRRRLAEG